MTADTNIYRNTQQFFLVLLFEGTCLVFRFVYGTFSSYLNFLLRCAGFSLNVPYLLECDDVLVNGLDAIEFETNGQHLINTKSTYNYGYKT